MRSLMRRVDRFCATHPKFGIKNLMLYITIGGAIVWIVGLMDTSGIFLSTISFDAQAIFTKGEIWRLITFVFIPNNSQLLWLVIELYFYYFIGNVLEASWGKGKFTIFYLSGVLLNIIFGALMWVFGGYRISVFASYLNLSLFFAFATLYPDTMVRVLFIIPVKVKYLAWVDVLFFALMIILNPFPVNLLPIVAILNYLIFCGAWLFDRVKPKNLKAQRAQRERTINFKKAAREYNSQQAKKPYTRKCEVCGRTDKDFPDLEFRFCSRCAGYHCFCVDHINSHVHFNE